MLQLSSDFNAVFKAEVAREDETNIKNLITTTQIYASKTITSLIDFPRNRGGHTSEADREVPTGIN